MIASKLITKIGVDLNDTNQDTYREAEIIDAINEGVLVILGIKVDANSNVSTFNTVTGSEQTLGATQRRLLDVIHNSSGISVRGAIESNILDERDTDWRSATGTNVIHFVYDGNVPQTFWIYPAIGVDTLKISTSDYPTKVSTGADTIGIDDVYIPALKKWCLHVMWSRDGTESPNYIKSKEIEAGFYQLLGIKSQVDQSISPNG